MTDRTSAHARTWTQAPRSKYARSTRHARSTTRGRLLAVCAALTLLVAVIAPAPAETSASWSDSEHASATLTAMTVPAPHITECTASYVVLLGSTIKIMWKPGPGATYGKDDVSALGSPNIAGLIDGTGLLSGESTSGPDGNGVYTTTLSKGVLSDLLNLGQTFYVGVQATDPQSGWTSHVSYAEATVPILIGNGTCTVAQNG